MRPLAASFDFLALSWESMADASVPGSDWERLLSAERHLQALVPGTVLVGGTATALPARHRVSLDGDHVVSELRDRFDQVLADLEAAAGWQTERVQRPVPILGRLDGVLTGIRQLPERRYSPRSSSVFGAAEPADASAIDLATYRGLVPPWTDWAHVRARGRTWARVLADQTLGRGPRV